MQPLYSGQGNPFIQKPLPTIPVGAPDDFETEPYRMLRDGPGVAPNEVEQVGVPAVEIRLVWGNSVLAVRQISPPRPVWMGDEESGCDFTLPRELLGAERVPLLLVDETGVKVVVPARASATRDGEAIEGTPLVAIERGHAVALAATDRVRIELGAFSFVISAGAAGKISPRSFFSSNHRQLLPYFGGTLLAAAALIGVVAWMTPAMGLSTGEDIDSQQFYAMKAYLDATSEREITPPPSAGPDSDQPSGSEGQASPGEEGALGKSTAAKTNRRYGIKGDPATPEIQLSRHELIEMATTFGLIGLLRGASPNDQDAPTSEFGRDVALGRDELSALGGLWGNELGDTLGGGLGLSGIGDSGGGKGEGIGLGNIGTIGVGVGNWPGRGFGKFGSPSSKGHATKVPRPRMQPPSVSGHLPGEVIQRIVRQNFGRFRLCYEQGLARNPNLQGRVTTRFLIDSRGVVSHAATGASDLPDASVTACVVRAFYGLSFPAPDTGTVRVSYPIVFSPA